MRRRSDRGEGPVSHLAVILLVAVIAAAVTAVALPDKVMGSIQASVCRVVGQDCADESTAAAPSTSPSSPGPSGSQSPPGLSSPAPGATTDPAPGQSGDPGGGQVPLTPEEEEYQQALAALTTAEEEASGAEEEWDAFDLLDELGELGLDFLIGDIQRCIEDPNLMDCLWALVGVVPWTKIGRVIKKIPKLARLADRFITLQRRLETALEARTAARSRFAQALDDHVRRLLCPAGAGPNSAGSRPLAQPAAYVPLNAVAGQSAGHTAPGCFALSMVSGPGHRYRSPQGLIYAEGSDEGHRILHVLRHGREDLNRPVHSVFKPDKGALEYVDEAWSMRHSVTPIQQGSRQIYIIPMNRTVGTAGEKYIRIVVENGNEVITAFPQQTGHL